MKKSLRIILAAITIVAAFGCSSLKKMQEQAENVIVKCDPQVLECIAGSIDATEVIDTVGDIRGLLYLDEEVTGSDGMESSGRQEIEVSLVRLVGGDDILHG